MFKMKSLFLCAGTFSLAILGGCGGGLDANPGTHGPTTLSARLTTSDFFDSATGRYYDIFVADALDSGTARVAMRSSEFDTQFYVYEKDSSGTYTLIDDNNDANGSTDSDDKFSVTQGNTYRILATSHRENERGSYEIRFSDILSAPAAVVTNDATLAKGKTKFSLPAISKK